MREKSDVLMEYSLVSRRYESSFIVEFHNLEKSSSRRNAFDNVMYVISSNGTRYRVVLVHSTVLLQNTLTALFSSLFTMQDP